MHESESGVLQYDEIQAKHFSRPRDIRQYGPEIETDRYREREREKEREIYI